MTAFFRISCIFFLLLCAIRLAALEEAPAETPEKIQQYIKALGNEAFEERETAAKALLKNGEASRPALDAASKNAEAEVFGRVRTLLRELDSRQTRIVFAKDGRIFVAHADYTDAKALTEEKEGVFTEPRLSPDGRKIVFCEKFPGVIWTMDSDGRNKEKLTPKDVQHSESHPCYSPDGKTILFTSWDKGSGRGEEWQLIKMDTSGGNRKIVGGGQNGVYLQDGRIVFQHLSYKPDGVYSYIAIRDVDRSSLKLLSSGKVWEESPEISPEGNTIVFCQRGEIWTMKLDGQDRKRITDTNAWTPSFSPDGRKILFSVYGESHGPADELKVLWMMNLDGSKQTKLGSGDKANWGRYFERK